MRFNLGPFTSSPDFIPDGPWKPIREPGPILMQILASPIAIVTGVLLAVLWFWLTPLSISPDGYLIAAMLGAGLLCFPLHEFVHMLVHPGSGSSEKSVVGVWPSRLLFYAQYDGELTRNRLLLILLMPFAVISVVPLLICASLQCSPLFLALLSLLNGLSACGDLFASLLVLFQVPGGAVLRNRDWWTYWRMADSDSPPAAS